MANQTVLYPHKGMLPSNKEKLTPDTHSNVDESPMHYEDQEKPDTKKLHTV